MDRKKKLTAILISHNVTRKVRKTSSLTKPGLGERTSRFAEDIAALEVLDALAGDRYLTYQSYLVTGKDLPGTD